MTDLGGSLKSAEAYRTISEVAADLKLPQHVLRFWETRFSQVKPLKRAGGRRFYRPEDVDLLRAVKALLYGDGYTIKGVQRLLREQGPKAVAALAASPSRRGPSQPAPSPSSRPTIERAAVEPPPVLRPLPVPVAPAQGSALREASLDLPASALPTARLRVVLADIEDCARILAELRQAAG